MKLLTNQIKMHFRTKHFSILNVSDHFAFCYSILKNSDEKRFLQRLSVKCEDFKEYHI